MTCAVNRGVKENSDASDTIFDLPTIVRALSRLTALEPGDVVLTGTPKGFRSLVNSPISSQVIWYKWRSKMSGGGCKMLSNRSNQT